jgi:hypothetical protein
MHGSCMEHQVKAIRCASCPVLTCELLPEALVVVVVVACCDCMAASALGSASPDAGLMWYEPPGSLSDRHPLSVVS